MSTATLRRPNERRLPLHEHLRAYLRVDTIAQSLSPGKEDSDRGLVSIYNLSRIPLGADLACRIHGGSFQAGSASGAGLDGSKLAESTGSIVAVIQYRLGVVSLFYSIIVHDLGSYIRNSLDSCPLQD